MKTITCRVSGTHCQACKMLIEDRLKEQSDIVSSRVDLGNQTVNITTTSQETTQEIATRLSPLVEPHGYTITTELVHPSTNYFHLFLAILLGSGLLGAFFILQRSGILNIGFGEHVTPSSAFMIGIIASLSSCLVIVGGLIFSLSATVSKNGSSRKPFLAFHIARVASFTILGGILGAAGTLFAVNHTVSTILALIVSAVMILLGVNLLDVFQSTKKWQPALHSSLFRRFTSHQETVGAPILLGVGTFFLPCGFTQAMQLQALASSSFFQGSVIMFSFALGTLPMLLVLSFGSFAFSKKPYAPLFFKTAGVVVIGLGISSFLAALTSLGVIPPLFTL